MQKRQKERFPLFVNGNMIQAFSVGDKAQGSDGVLYKRLPSGKWVPENYEEKEKPKPKVVEGDMSLLGTIINPSESGTCPLQYQLHDGKVVLVPVGKPYVGSATLSPSDKARHQHRVFKGK